MSDQNFIDAIQTLHGVELTESDIGDLHRYQFEQRQASALRRHQTPGVIDYDIRGDRIVKSVISGAVGFFTTGNPVAGALAFAGSLLSSANQRGDKNVDEKAVEERRTFDSGGALAIARSPIPLVYGNRAINPAGGVRVGGILINNRIDTVRGSTRLFALYLLAAGQAPGLSYGFLGSVDESRTLFNGQPRDNYTEDEIQIDTRLGQHAQSPYPEIQNFSQVVTPSDYNTWGIDLKTTVTGSIIVTSAPSANAPNVTLSGKTIRKTSGGAGWNAGAFSNTPLTNGCYIQFSPLGIGLYGAGLSHQDIDQNWTSIQFGFYFNGTQAYAVESGSLAAGPYPYNGDDLFLITFDNTEGVQYFKNGEQLYDSAIAPSLPLYADIAINTLNCGFDRLKTSREPNGIQSTADITSAFQVADFESLSTAQEYRIRNGLNTKKLRIDDKDYGTEEITAIGDVGGFGNGSEIYGYYYARYQTTKHVSRIDLNIAFSLSARDADDNDPQAHGTLFDLFIRDVPATVSWTFVGRFYAESESPQQIYRAISIRNLKLGNYRIKIEPLIADPGDETIRELTDEGRWMTFNASGAIAGKTPKVRIEGRNRTGGLNIGFDNKTDISSQRGPTGKLVTVNEIVLPTDIGFNGAFRYRSLATQLFVFEASERITGNPEVTSFIDLCRVIPNHMAAGRANASSTPTQLNDIAADFIASGAQPGWKLRNLTRKIETQIQSVTANSIVTLEPLYWQYKDRYLVFFEGASPYLPDIYCDLARNPLGGGSKFIDPDLEIDYESMVASRKFCVNNQYFWDYFVSEPKPFAQWGEENAVTCRLFPIKVDGRFGLLPEEQRPIQQVFNAANLTNFKEDYPEWKRRATNQLVVTWRDGRDRFDQDNGKGRFKTITIETDAVYNDLEPPVTETLDCPSITRREQAIEIGVAYFNSLRRQGRSVSFQTDLSGFYVDPGEIIMVSHPSREIGDEISGFVVDVVANNIMLSSQPIMAIGTSDGTDSLADDAVDFLALGITTADVAIAPSGTYTITSVSAHQVEVAVPIPRGETWRIMNISPAQPLQAAATQLEDGATLVVAAAPTIVNNAVYYQLTPMPDLQVGDRVIVGPNLIQYRVQSANYGGDRKVQISATEWVNTLNDQTGLKIWVDDEVLG